MRAGSSPVLCTTAFATVAPSSSTGTVRRLPPKAPTAVRTGETIAARLMGDPFPTDAAGSMGNQGGERHVAKQVARARAAAEQGGAARAEGAQHEQVGAVIGRPVEDEVHRAHLARYEALARRADAVARQVR